jgi:hypothetical protein
MMVAGESAIYYPHHEGGLMVSMRIHDVVCKYAVNYLHHEGA